MNKLLSFCAAGSALLLTGVLFCPASFGQVSPVPEAVQAPKPPVFVVLPPVLPGGIDYCDLQFEIKGDTLLLTQPLMFWSESLTDQEASGPLPTHSKVLWSGKLGTEPQKFTLESTKTEEDIKDSVGKILWSEHFQEPSLTLDFSRQDEVVLRDSMGKELGSSSYAEPTTHGIPVPPAHPATTNISIYDGIRIETDRQTQQTKIYSGNQLMWTGHRPPNDGIRYGNLPTSQIDGIPSPQLPPGVIVTFSVSREVDTATVSDGSHHVLETCPVDALRMTASCNNNAYRKNMRNWFLFYPHMALTEFQMIAPGQIFVETRSAGGDWVAKESLKATADVQKVSWSSKPATRLTFDMDVYDKDGNVARTQPMGWRYLPQN